MLRVFKELKKQIKNRINILINVNYHKLTDGIVVKNKRNQVIGKLLNNYYKNTQILQSSRLLAFINLY